MLFFSFFHFFFLSSSLSLSHPFPLPVPLFKGRWRWNEFFFLLCPSFTAESRRAIDEQRRSIVSPIGSFLIAPIQNWTWTFSIRMYMCSIVLIELFSTSLSERWIVSGLLFFFFPSSSSFFLFSPFNSIVTLRAPGLRYPAYIIWYVITISFKAFRTKRVSLDVAFRYFRRNKPDLF